MRAIMGVAVVAMALLTACEDEEQDKQFTKPETSSAKAATAERFAPMVHLAKGETLTPMDATRFVERSALRFLHNGCADVEPVADPVDPRRLGEGDYKHKDADPVEPLSPPPPLDSEGPPCVGHNGAEHSTNDETSGFYLDPPDDIQSGATKPDEKPDAPVYWEQHREGDGRTAYVYWFFYGRNELNPVGNKHEGDWERIAVQLRDDKPLAVTFYKHGGKPCMVPWQEMTKRDDHAVVYSARGSHGSYPDDGWHAVGPVYDRTSAGAEWTTWSQAKPVDQEPWYGYRGWWGSPATLPGFDGPKGPHRGRFLADVFTEDRCGPPDKLPAGFAGAWETRDPVQQTPAASPYHMRVVLGDEQSSVQYRTTWTEPDAQLACNGVLAPTDMTDKWLELRETITTDPRLTCVREGTVRLVLNGDSLQMSYTSGTIKGSATLYRRDGAGGPPAPPPPATTATAPSSADQSKSGAIKRHEQFLHALGREDIATVCEIAAPAAKKAEAQGFGPCEQTFRMTFQMISPAQKRALQSATVDPGLVTQRARGKVEIPAKAVKASTKFTDGDLGDYTLEYRNGQWFIID